MGLTPRRPRPAAAAHRARLADRLPRRQGHGSGGLYRVGLALAALADPARVRIGCPTGCSARRPRTNAWATWRTRSSRAASSTTRAAASCGCTTARQTPRSASRRRSSTTSWPRCFAPDPVWGRPLGAARRGSSSRGEAARGPAGVLLEAGEAMVAIVEDADCKQARIETSTVALRIAFTVIAVVCVMVSIEAAHRESRVWPRPGFGKEVRAREMDELTLLDWKRRIFELYAAVRARSRPRARAWRHWREARDELFRSHPQTPVPAGAHVRARPLLRLRPGASRARRPSSGPSGSRARSRPRGERAVLVHAVRTRALHARRGARARPLLARRATAAASTSASPTRPAAARPTARAATCSTRSRAPTSASSNGKLVLDFNFAYNPSCSYDPRWVCPLAPPGNRLAVPIRGGER